MNTPVKWIAATALACMAGLAAAQDYPARAIKVIVPLTPGSGADIAGRIVATPQ